MRNHLNAFFGGKLFPFQRTGIAWAERWRRTIIADEMGLGKTVQALGWLAYQTRDKLPAVVVCPASVRGMWVQECRRHLPPGLKIIELSGRAKGRPMPRADVYVVNYDILAGKDGWGVAMLLRFKRTVGSPIASFILDEMHYCKGGKKTARGKMIIELSKRARNVIGLTGTPVLSRPADLWPLLHIIQPTHWPAFWPFAMRFCDPKTNKWGWDVRGASNLGELRGLINARHSILRRLKKHVAPELPGKMRATVPLPLSDRAAYERAEAEVCSWLRTNSGKKVRRIAVLEKLEMLKQECFALKWEAAREWIDDALEDGGKLIVFCTHRGSVQTVRDAFPNISVAVDGGTPTHERQGIIDRFATDPNTRLLVGNLQAAGQGLDGMQRACSRAVFLELGWTPAEHDQAEDRLARLGQTEPVTCYYLTAQDTIEDYIADVLNRKARIIGTLLGGNKTLIEKTQDVSLLEIIAKKIMQKGQHDATDNRDSKHFE